MENLLKQLSAAACLGAVEDAFDIAERFLSPFAAVKRTCGRLVATLDGVGEPLLLEAHLDEVGFVVTNVAENGFVKVAAVGSVDSRILTGVRVRLYGEKTVEGVFISTPPHLSEEKSAPKLEDLFIDVGPAQAKFLKAGDFATYATLPQNMLGTTLCGKAMDNRSGVAAVLKAAANIAAVSAHRPITVLLTVGEELGLRGAKTGGFDLFDRVKQAIAVDVSFGNFSGCDPYKTAKLGTGAMIGISPVLHRPMYRRLEQLAKDLNIAYTREIMAGNTGTNADALSVTCGGIETALLSIPLRNMHTPCEVVDLNDIAAVVNLIVAYATESEVAV